MKIPELDITMAVDSYGNSSECYQHITKWVVEYYCNIPSYSGWITADGVKNSMVMDPDVLNPEIKDALDELYRFGKQ